MANQHSNRSKPLIYLVLLLAIWFFTPTLLKQFNRAAFYEMQAPLWVATSHVRDLQTFWALKMKNKNDLIEAGRDLARMNAAYQLKAMENDSLKEEIHRLENILSIPRQSGFRYEIARVVKREINGWWQQMILRKGEDYGIIPGAAVIYSGGVVGRVREVYAYTCLVDRVSSRDFRMAANIENDSRPVSYQGIYNAPFCSPKGAVFNVPPDIKPQERQRLISSELGGLFPAGLLIGWVEDLTMDDNGLFQRGRIQLNEDLYKIKEVAIILPIEIEEGL